MRPFPPVDELEVIERHAAIDEAIFRNLPVFLEGRLPIGRAERRYGAEQGLPFGDRQAGMSEPGCAADDHHYEDQGCNKPEPGANIRPG
jgi:hypothetical protein